MSVNGAIVFKLYHRSNLAYKKLTHFCDLIGTPSRIREVFVSLASEVHRGELVIQCCRNRKPCLTLNRI
jgi:hypothetical protein